MNICFLGSDAGVTLGRADSASSSIDFSRCGSMVQAIRVIPVLRANRLYGPCRARCNSTTSLYDYYPPGVSDKTSWQSQRVDGCF